MQIDQGNAATEELVDFDEAHHLIVPGKNSLWKPANGSQYNDPVLDTGYRKLSNYERVAEHLAALQEPL